MKSLIYFIFFIILSFQVYGQEVLKNVYSPNRKVNDVKVDDNIAYIAGDFDYVGPNTGAAGVFGTTMEYDSNFPRIEGVVDAAFPDGKGGWYIGGDFDYVGDYNIPNLAHILSNDSVDVSFNFGVEGEVRTIVVFEGFLFFGGNFRIPQILLEDYKGLAGIDLIENSLLDWNPRPNSTVFTLEEHNGKLWIGGDFDVIDGKDINCLAIFNPLNNQTSGLDYIFYSNQLVGPGIYDILFADNMMFLSGFFSSIAGSDDVYTRKNIASFSDNGFAITNWSPDTLVESMSDSKINCMLYYGGIIYAGGDFENIGDAQRKNLAAIDATTGIISDFNPQFDSQVRVLKRNGNTLYIGGDFSFMGTVRRGFTAAYNLATLEPAEWDVNAQSNVLCIEMNNNKMFIGGTFNSVGGIIRNNLAAIDLTNGKPTSWAPNANNEVYALEIQNDKIYAGGIFTTIGGEARNRIARLDKTTGFADSWAPEADGTVYDIKAQGNRVYTAGMFANIGGANRSNLAALDSTTGVAVDWTPEPSDIVIKIDVRNDVVYAAGGFQNIGGASRSFLAAIDPVTGTATDWDPSPDDLVVSLLATEDKVFVGGMFRNIGGEARHYAAALSPANGLADAWAPNLDGPVAAFAKGADRFYIGGQFNQIDGERRISIASFDLNTGGLLPWNPEISGSVGTISFANNTVLAGGRFSNVNKVEINNFTAIYDTTTITYVAENIGKLVPSEFSLSQNYPNPFGEAVPSGNPTTTIKYSIPSVGTAHELSVQIRLIVYDILGRKITTLVNEKQTPGNYSVQFNAANMPSGIYFYTLRAGGFTTTKKMILMK